jgi:hypothetical protein
MLLLAETGAGLRRRLRRQASDVASRDCVKANDEYPSWSSEKGLVMRGYVQNTMHNEGSDSFSVDSSVTRLCLHSQPLETLFVKLGIVGSNMPQTPSAVLDRHRSCAAEKAHESLVELLIERGAGKDSKHGLYGETPLAYAAKRGHWPIVRPLAKTGRGCDKAKDGGTHRQIWSAF